MGRQLDAELDRAVDGDLVTDHPIDLCRWQVANCYMGRIGLINSGVRSVRDYLEDRRFFVEAYQNPESTYTPADLVGMVDQFGAAFEPGTEPASVLRAVPSQARQEAEPSARSCR